MIEVIAFIGNFNEHCICRGLREKQQKPLVNSVVFWQGEKSELPKTSDIRRTLVGNEIVDQSDVVGASPVGAAPTTSSFST